MEKVELLGRFEATNGAFVATETRFFRVTNRRDGARRTATEKISLELFRAAP